MAATYQELKQEWLRRLLTMQDNPSLSEKTLRRYQAMYSGVFYERYIAGKWVLAEGLVYPMFGESCITDQLPCAGEYYISCDYGTMNPFLAGLWRFDGQTATRIREYYHDGRKTGAQKTDEENGALMAGVRYWRIDPDKPLRATLYALDGYTEYIQRKNEEMQVLRQKRAYQKIVKTSVADGTEYLDGGNYPGFPIVPLWGSPLRQSELVGMKQSIDCYDLIKSGFANDLDDASMIYWTLENAGGMDDIDLAQFVERMKTVKAAAVDGDAKVEAHTLDVPYASRVAYLEKLEHDMYADFQALNVSQLSAGAKTATEINAAYEPLNNKTDQYEYGVLEFLRGIFRLAGIDDNPTFKRSRVVNQMEETQMVLMAAQYLDDETILKKLPWLTPEEARDILARRDAEDMDRLGAPLDREVTDDDGQRA